jgi:hypothetical protein
MISLILSEFIGYNEKDLVEMQWIEREREAKKSNKNW